ncbi:hypothetical protein PMIN01_12171 [Paraphaeosphaeria minitans]|uniref:Myb-like domain-containing protein n=1 Tax=Paraphaeosphaeria minitans TaxID=565426 RepID=A0A9P6KK95_9PLEO|nr:hypothetical protein PMIN01_12171 [Paraphaeosphaeria minitans]
MSLRRTPKYTPQEERRLKAAKSANPTANWQIIRTIYNRETVDRRRRRTALGLQKKWAVMCDSDTVGLSEPKPAPHTPSPEHEDHCVLDPSDRKKPSPYVSLPQASLSSMNNQQQQDGFANHAGYAYNGLGVWYQQGQQLIPAYMNHIDALQKEIVRISSQCNGLFHQNQELEAEKFHYKDMYDKVKERLEVLEEERGVNVTRRSRRLRQNGDKPPA